MGRPCRGQHGYVPELSDQPDLDDLELMMIALREELADVQRELRALIETLRVKIAAKRSD